MARFNVGDRVKCVSDDSGGGFVGMEGVVLSYDSYDRPLFTVDFDFGMRSPTGQGGSRWHFWEAELELLPPVSPIPIGANPPEEKVVGPIAKVCEQLGVDPAPKRENVLEEAIRVTSGDRRRDYGSAKVNHDRIALFWAAWDLAANGTDEEIAAGLSAIRPLAPEFRELDSARDVAVKMILLKVAREANTPKRDNKTDIAGYARCLSQIDGEEEGF